jgi:hypothetical protein
MLLLLAGCGALKHHHASVNGAASEAIHERKAFTPVFEKALYRARLSVHGQDLQGLMMIKVQDDGSHKVAFFNELGMNFFDFELLQGEKANYRMLRVNNIYSSLNRKNLLKAFEKQFSMLMGPAMLQSPAFEYMDDKHGRRFLKVDSYRGKDCYYFEDTPVRFYMITNVAGLCRNEKVVIDIYYHEDEPAPGKIRITQAEMKISFSLEKINSQ